MTRMQAAARVLGVSSDLSDWSDLSDKTSVFRRVIRVS